jgi:hypothetical protein
MIGVKMKLDKSKLEEFKRLSDEELWLKIRDIAQDNGINLPDRKPTESEFNQLRELLFAADKINPLSAMKMINKFKRGGENG